VGLWGITWHGGSLQSHFAPQRSSRTLCDWCDEHARKWCTRMFTRVLHAPTQRSSWSRLPYVRRGYQCHGRKGASFSIFPCSGWALSVSLPIRYTVAALGLSGGVPETVAKFLVVMASKMTKDSGWFPLSGTHLEPVCIKTG
jgi:hypothetical protein